MGHKRKGSKVKRLLLEVNRPITDSTSCMFNVHAYNHASSIQLLYLYLSKGVIAYVLLICFLVDRRPSQYSTMTSLLLTFRRQTQPDSWLLLIGLTVPLSVSAPLHHPTEHHLHNGPPERPQGPREASVSPASLPDRLPGSRGGGPGERPLQTDASPAAGPSDE